MALAVVGLPGCLEQPSLPVPADGVSDAAYSVSVVPESAPDEVPAVLRVAVEANTSVDPALLALFEGELSSYHRGRIVRQDLPKTLEERRVPALAFGGDGVSDRAWLAPLESLTAGATYSVALLGVGVLGEMMVTSDPEKPLLKLFPGSDVPHSARYAVYCSEKAVDSLQQGAMTQKLSGALRANRRVWEGELAPLGARAELVTGAWPGSRADNCVHLAVGDGVPDGEAVLPPLNVAGFPLEPAPLVAADVAGVKALSCSKDEAQVRPGCATVQDDRIILRGPGEPMLFGMQSGNFEWLLVGKGPWVLGGLTPERDYQLNVFAIDASGHKEERSVSVTTTKPRDRIAINEVLANPIGLEPAQEWVELVNDGVTSVDLSGWTLEDIGGVADLSGVTLKPKGFALVVREDFDPNSPFDVGAASGTKLIRVPHVGKNGLANSGEPLRLKDRAGVVVSEFFSVLKPKPGGSVARVTPSALTERTDTFLLHGPPGASPGAPNQF